MLDSPNLFAAPYNIPTSAKAVQLMIKAKCKVQTIDLIDVRPEATLYIALTYAGDTGTVNAVCDAAMSRRQSGPNNPNTRDGTSASITGTQINFANPIIRLNRTAGDPNYGKFKLRRITSLIYWSAQAASPYDYTIVNAYNFNGSGYPVVYIDMNVYLVGYYA